MSEHYLEYLREAVRTTGSAEAYELYLMCFTAELENWLQFFNDATAGPSFLLELT